ncbi:MAG: YfjI family protein [Phycisphaerales bacterium]
MREALEPGYKAYAEARKNGTWTGPNAPWPPSNALFVEPEPPPFPLDEGYPESLKELRDFIRALAHEVQVPVDLVAMLVIAVAAACLSKKFEIEARAGWREICVIWVLVLLLSGERKSVIFRRLTDVILEWEKEEAERLGPEIASANEEREIVERQRAEARKKAGKGNAQAREEAIALAKRLAEMLTAVPPTLITTDATSEALVGLMKSNGERALVASPEADALDVLMGRYDDKARPNMGVWLKAYSGDRIRVHRRGRPPEFLDNPALGVAMTVQPEAVRGMFANSAARGRGLLARFFPSVPRSMVGRRTIGTPPVPDRLECMYLATIRRLLDIPLDIEGGPRILRLGPDALALFTRFEIDVERALGDEGDLADRRDWGAKLCGGILRIALTLHCLEVFGRGATSRTGEAALEVSRETMIAALSWAPYLIEHERIANRIVGCDLVAAIAERVLKWLARSGKAEFSKREAFDAVRGRVVQSVELMEYPLGLLEELGYVRPMPGQPPVGRVGRPPSARYAVNPLWDRDAAADGMDEKTDEKTNEQTGGSEGTA